jgi:GTP-binding protein Era
MVFFDTPGVHEGEKLINRYMVKEALSCLPDLNVAVFLADATEIPHRDDEALARHLAGASVPILLALNKVDVGCVPAPFFSALLPFRSVHKISAVSGQGVEGLLDDIASLLPEGPEYYPDDALTDRSERFIAEEFIREKVFALTGEEVPYSVAVTVDSWKDTPETGLVVIHATIHVERDSQKGILIGKGAHLIKEIGKRARLDLEALLGARVYLDLHVGVEKNWTREPAALKRFGYEVKP